MEDIITSSSSQNLQPVTVIHDNRKEKLPLGKKLKSTFILAILAILLIGGMSVIYFSWLAPIAQAKEYLQETSNDFQVIQAKLQQYETAFNPLAKSFEVSREAFFEITSSRPYLETIKHAKQDIEDIRVTLQLIEEARQTKKNLKVPEKFITLDQQLGTYYEKVEEKERVSENISTPSATLEPTPEDSTPSATTQLNFHFESSQAAN